MQSRSWFNESNSFYKKKKEKKVAGKAQIKFLAEPVGFGPSPWGSFNFTFAYCKSITKFHDLFWVLPLLTANTKHFLDQFSSRSQEDIAREIEECANLRSKRYFDLSEKKNFISFFFSFRQ